ncbi:translation initiation factor 2 [Solwaraspora sp. WMMD406]|uniref:translation initiation factor 2 n=1 Tax=Solwaraspora sp. WMMD406 TaxID=3016095 RepID=UPI00241653AE|nr:translation initiation factor 2 [Solwaraspora sp. WMMD406]MDG4768105.1 translation initiation factor 2 [Solwaraspora sp. WMMD406]
MSTDRGEPDDGFWRRPASAPPGVGPDPGTGSGPATGLGPTGTGGGPAAPTYPGPPAAAPPPPGWRPPLVVRPAPPRSLPPQDIEAVENDERNARTVTYGVGMIAAAVLVIVICLLCSRVLF